MNQLDPVAPPVERSSVPRVLRDARIFDHCTDEEFGAIASVCTEAEILAGQTIFEADERADRLYLVADGTVELQLAVTIYGAVRPITIDRKFKGDVLGWSAVVEPHIYTLSAVAKKDTRLLQIDSTDLERLAEENPHFGHMLMYNIANLVGQRLDVMRRMLADVIEQRRR
jgi:CRP-like cAMP-binding protein